MIEAFLGYAAVIGIGFAGATALQSRFSPKEGRLLLASFVMHVLFCFANAWMIKYVYGRGDPLMFVSNGTSVRDIVALDPLQMGPELLNMLLARDFELPVDLFGGKRSTYSMYAASAILQFVIGSEFGVVHMAFAVMSYFGKAAIYLFFREQFPRRYHMGALWAAMLVPTVVFWSAGIIKETIVILGLGGVSLGVQLAQRKRAVGLLLIGPSFYAIALIKPFILLATAVSVAAWLAWDRSVRRGRVTIQPHYLLLSGVLGLFGLFGVGVLFPQFSIDRLGEEIATFQGHGGKGNSGIHMGDATNTSLLGQMQYVPFALFLGLYRPGIWEASNPQMLINGLETLGFLVFSIRGAITAGYSGMMARLVRYPFLMFCIVFALTMAVGTGLTTFNLGSLSRYRMPLLPFFVTFLVVMNLPLASDTERVKVPVPPRRRVRQAVRRPRGRRPARANRRG